MGTRIPGTERTFLSRQYSASRWITMDKKENIMTIAVIIPFSGLTLSRGFRFCYQWK
jgi:hypothetical protein